MYVTYHSHISQEDGYANGGDIDILDFDDYLNEIEDVVVKRFPHLNGRFECGTSKSLAGEFVFSPSFDDCFPDCEDELAIKEELKYIVRSVELL